MAKNNVGYLNLMKLVSLSYINSNSNVPLVDFDLIEKYKEGIIALSSGLNGEVAHYASNNDYDNALNSAKKIKQIFNGNFYLEIQNHGIENQAIALSNISKISKSYQYHLSLLMIHTILIRKMPNLVILLEILV